MMHAARIRSKAGFTLLELLVALAIFGLLATMSYGGLRAVLSQQAQTDIAADRLSELQKLYLIMQRDIEQAVPRSIRNEFGDTEPPLVGSVNLQLTRGGWSNPVGRLRSTLQRVGYTHEEEELVRFSWMVLDRAQDSAALKQPLVGAITGLQFRYLDERDEWQDQWPAAIPAATPGVTPPIFPKAVEVTLEHENYGSLVWLFQVPQ